MSKLCVVYNFAQLYREPIFKAIDSEWDCDWYFGRNTTDIKGMPEDALKHTTFVDNKFLVGPICWQSGIGHLMRDKRYDRYLMLGEPMCLSTWWNLIQRRLFYRKKRVYLWTHGWYGREGFAKKWIKRAFFGLADHVFTYGDYARQQAILQGFDGSKITPIHNSLNYENQKRLREGITDTAIFRNHFGNDDPTLLFVGRLTKVKRIDMLVEALDLLRQRGINANLALIGDGSETESLRQLVKEKGLDKRVWFYGACYDDSRNAALIYNADLCVAPGNVGLTAMHSMAFGTPVLTHDNFKMQMPEFEAIAPGKTGSFFAYGSVESMADEIARWLSAHTADRDAIRRACYNEIESSWSVPFQMNVLRSKIK